MCWLKCAFEIYFLLLSLSHCLHYEKKNRCKQIGFVKIALIRNEQSSKHTYRLTHTHKKEIIIFYWLCNEHKRNEQVALTSSCIVYFSFWQFSGLFWNPQNCVCFSLFQMKLISQSSSLSKSWEIRDFGQNDWLAWWGKFDFHLNNGKIARENSIDG